MITLFTTGTWKEHIKYPVLLFFVLLFAKIIYIIVESQYNHEILETLTQASLDTRIIDELNEFGHRISSVGFTLLLVPLFYFIFKRYKTLTMYLLISLSSIVSYVTIKHSLNVLVDTIVEKHSDKRYNAYYTNIFKYGVLNGHFTYDSFIPSKNIREDTLTIEQKLLIINTFLITYADKALIDKLLSRGSDKISELYLDMDNDSEYEKSYEDFKKFSSEITQLWTRFAEERKNLSEQINKLEDESHIKTAYEEMQDDLKKEYKAYKLATKEIDEKVKEETAFFKLIGIEKELKKYFKYKKYKKAQLQYKEEMHERFGRYIESNRWCSDYVCPTKQKIIEVIKQEIEHKAQDKLQGIPSGLSFKTFLDHIQVKTKVAQKLKNKGMSIPKNFNYSYQQFKSHYISSLSKKKKMMIDTFYDAIQKELGENDIKLSDTWEDFVMSQYITKKIKKDKSDFDEKTLKRIQALLISKNIGNFREKVYLPSVQDEVTNQIYTEDDFKNLPEAMKKGDDALKLLYVPPFALALSMVALLLNFVTVFVMIYMLFPASYKKVRFFVRPLLFLVLFLIPYAISPKIDTLLIKEAISDNPSMQRYLNFLSSLQMYEKINASFYHSNPKGL